MNAADAVYRPGAITTGSDATFTVDGQSLAADNSQVTYGVSKAASAGSQVSVTAQVPDSTWAVAGVKIKDTSSGDDVTSAVKGTGSIGYPCEGCFTCA